MTPEDRGGPTLLARPVMRDAFRKQLRSRVMVEAAVAFAPIRRRSPFFMWMRPAFAPAFAAALVMIVAMAGATSAAASSLPGDPAFGLKRAAEDLRVALTFDDVVRVRLLADLADRRLAELAEVARERPSAAPAATAEFAGALDRIADAEGGLRESDGKRAAALALAEAARDRHIALLDSLKPRLPVEAQPSLQRVIEKEKQRATDADRDRRGGGSDERTGDRKGETRGTGTADKQGQGSADKKDKRAPDSKDQPGGGRGDGRAGDKKDENTADRSEERTDERSGDRGGTGQGDVKRASPTPKPTPTKK